MKVAAAEAIAGVVGHDLSPTLIVPSPFNPASPSRVAGRVGPPPAPMVSPGPDHVRRLRRLVPSG